MSDPMMMAMTVLPARDVLAVDAIDGDMTPIARHGYPVRAQHRGQCCRGSEALAEGWPTDAHMLPYVSLRRDLRGYRLTRRMITSPEMTGQVAYTWLVYDIDNPGHAAWQDLQDAVMGVYTMRCILLDSPVGSCMGIYATTHGLRLVAPRAKPVRHEAHRREWIRVHDHLLSLGIPSDTACKDITRCFRMPLASRSDDRLAGQWPMDLRYMRPVDPSVLPPIAAEFTPVYNDAQDHTVSDADMVRAAEAIGFLDMDDREVWLRVGMALRSTGHPQARAVWDAASASSTKYDAAAQEYTWSSLRPDGGVTMGTVYHAATQAGWTDTTDIPLDPDDAIWSLAAGAGPAPAPSVQNDLSDSDSIQTSENVHHPMAGWDRLPAGSTVDIGGGLVGVVDHRSGTPILTVTVDVPYITPAIIEATDPGRVGARGRIVRSPCGTGKTFAMREALAAAPAVLWPLPRRSLVAKAVADQAAVGAAVTDYRAMPDGLISGHSRIAVCTDSLHRVDVASRVVVLDEYATLRRHECGKSCRRNDMRAGAPGLAYAALCTHLAAAPRWEVADAAACAAWAPEIGRRAGDPNAPWILLENRYRQPLSAAIYPASADGDAQWMIDLRAAIDVLPTGQWIGVACSSRARADRLARELQDTGVSGIGLCTSRTPEGEKTEMAADMGGYIDAHQVRVMIWTQAAETGIDYSGGDCAAVYVWLEGGIPTAAAAEQLYRRVRHPRDPEIRARCRGQRRDLPTDPRVIRDGLVAAYRIGQHPHARDPYAIAWDDVTGSVALADGPYLHHCCRVEAACRLGGHNDLRAAVLARWARTGVTVRYIDVTAAPAAVKAAKTAAKQMREGLRAEEVARQVAAPPIDDDAAAELAARESLSDAEHSALAAHRRREYMTREPTADEVAADLRGEMRRVGTVAAIASALADGEADAVAQRYGARAERRGPSDGHGSAVVPARVALWILGLLGLGPAYRRYAGVHFHSSVYDHHPTSENVHDDVAGAPMGTVSARCLERALGHILAHRDVLGEHYRLSLPDPAARARARAQYDKALAAREKALEDQKLTAREKRVARRAYRLPPRPRPAAAIINDILRRAGIHLCRVRGTDGWVLDTAQMAALAPWVAPERRRIDGPDVPGTDIDTDAIMADLLADLGLALGQDPDPDPMSMMDIDTDAIMADLLADF